MNTSQSMKFGHFGINCFDVTRMEDFYTRVVGMVVADRGYVPPPADRNIVFMTLDPGEHHAGRGREPESRGFRPRDFHTSSFPRHYVAGFRPSPE